MKEYLEELRKLLINNNYQDVDNTIDYFNEMILDRIENGETEEEILDELGDVQTLAQAILEDKKINIDDVGECIMARLISADIFISSEDVEEIKVETNNSDIFSIEKQGDVIYIKEMSSSGIKINNKVYVYIPNGGYVEKVNIETVSGDININGPFTLNIQEIKTVSGDVIINDVLFEEVTCKSVSGDIRLFTLRGNDISILSTSGDIKTNLLECNNGSFNTKSGNIETLNSEIDNYKALSVSGDIVTYTKGNHIKCNSTSGDIFVHVEEPQDEYHVEYQGRSDKKIGSKSLIINTKSGDADYKFENN